MYMRITYIKDGFRYMCTTFNELSREIKYTNYNKIKINLGHLAPVILFSDRDKLFSNQPPYNGLRYIMCCTRRGFNVNYYDAANKFRTLRTIAPDKSLEYIGRWQSKKNCAEHSIPFIGRIIIITRFRLALNISPVFQFISPL